MHVPSPEAALSKLQLSYSTVEWSLKEQKKQEESCHG